MTSKERVQRAFGEKQGLPDRVPIQFDLCRPLIDHFAAELDMDPEYALSYYEDLTYRISANGIRTTLGSDVVVVGGTVPTGYEAKPVEGNITENEFGMHMKPTELYVEVVKAPLEELESVEDVEAYAFPDPYAPGRFDIAKQQIDTYGDEYYVIGDVEISIFEFAWQLTGMEKYLVGLAGGEDWIPKLNDRVEYWSTQLGLQLIDAGVDALWMGEDLGTQTSMLISPAMWRNMFKPRWERMIKTFREKDPNITMIMHSDGAVAPLLDDFAELGFDVYNPVQPNVPGSDPEELKSNYGNELSFFGGIDQQKLLPEGDPEAIRAEIKRRIEILGRGGGYLLAPAHIIQNDVSPDTVRLMVDAAKEYGSY
jgi:uroporphyrinogen decarboxylase